MPLTRHPSLTISSFCSLTLLSTIFSIFCPDALPFVVVRPRLVRFPVDPCDPAILPCAPNKKGTKLRNSNSCSFFSNHPTTPINVSPRRISIIILAPNLFIAHLLPVLYIPCRGAAFYSSASVRRTSVGFYFALNRLK